MAELSRSQSLFVDPTTKVSCWLNSEILQIMVFDLYLLTPLTPGWLESADIQ